MMINKQDRYKRLISVQLLRSAAIVYLIFFNNLKSISSLNGADNSQTILLESAFSFPLMLLGGSLWGLIPFLFGIAISWSITGRIIRNESLSQLFKKSVFVLLFLTGVDLIRSYFFAGLMPLPFTRGGGGSVISLSMQSGMLVFPPVEQLFSSGFLIIIASTTIISIGVVLLLMKYGPEERFYIPVVMTIVGAAWLLFMGSTAAPFYEKSVELFNEGGMSSFYSYLLYNWGGRDFSAMIIAPYSIFGVIFGYHLALVKNKRDFYYSTFFYILLFSGLLIFLSGTDLIASQLTGGNSFSGFSFLEYNSRIFILMNLIALFILMLFLTARYDIQSNISGFPKKKPLIFLRQNSLILLTVYLVEPAFTALFSGIKEGRLALFMGLSFSQYNGYVANLIYMVFVLSFWFCMISLWRLAGFRFSLEASSLFCYRFLNLLLNKIPFLKNRNKQGFPIKGSESRGEAMERADRLIFYLEE